MQHMLTSMQVCQIFNFANKIQKSYLSITWNVIFHYLNFIAMQLFQIHKPSVKSNSITLFYYQTMKLQKLSKKSSKTFKLQFSRIFLGYWKYFRFLSIDFLKEYIIISILLKNNYTIPVAKKKAGNYMLLTAVNVSRQNY